MVLADICFHGWHAFLIFKLSLMNITIFKLIVIAIVAMFISPQLLWLQMIVPVKIDVNGISLFSWQTNLDFSECNENFHYLMSIDYKKVEGKVVFYGKTDAFSDNKLPANTACFVVGKPNDYVYPFPLLHKCTGRDHHL